MEGQDKRLSARELKLGKYLPTSGRIGEGYACHISGQPMHCLCVVSLSEIFVFIPLLKLAVGLTVTDPKSTSNDFFPVLIPLLNIS